MTSARIGDMPPRWLPGEWATPADVRRALDPVLASIADFRRTVMQTLADFQAAFAEVDAETTRIGNYIEQILAQLNRTDLTDAEEATVLASLQAAATRLKGVGV